MNTIVLPVKEDLPAFDFLRKDRGVELLRSYHLEDQFTMLREAFEVTDFFFKNKIKSCG